MKKFTPVFAGACIAAVMLLLSVAAPDLIEIANSAGRPNATGQTQPDATGQMQPNAAGQTQPDATGQTQPDATGQLDSSNDTQTFESPIIASGTEGIVPGGYVYAKVKRIVDGDTLRAEYKGKEYKIRLLCIDTPETVKVNVDEQPFGKLASEKLTEMLLNEEVSLVFEKDIDDNYDRLLAYVLLEDGTCVNAFMVEQGFARIDMVRPNTVNRDYFTKLQDNAIKEGKGLWALPVEDRPFIMNDKGYYIPRYIDSDAS